METNTPQPEQQPPVPSAPKQPAELNAQADIRLKVLEQTQEKMFSILTWGFGSLIIVALALVGGNWLSSKMNYEKDGKALADTTELLKSQLNITKQELMLANNGQLADIRSESVSNIAAQFSFDEKQLADDFISISNRLIDIADVSSQQLNQLLQSNATKSANDIADLKSHTATTLLELNGLTFFEQGMAVCNNNKGDTPEQQIMLFAGIKSYVSAAQNFIDANSEENLARAMNNIAEIIVRTINFQPNIVHSAYEAPSVDAQLEALIKRIEENPARANRNEGSIVKIKASMGYLNRIIGK